MIVQAQAAPATRREALDAIYPAFANGGAGRDEIGGTRLRPASGG